MTDSEKAEAYLATLTDEDKEQLRAALQTWKDEGQESPLIPTDTDIDGDGTADAFGLDDQGNLTIVFGVKLEETVYEADGDGTTTEAAAAAAELAEGGE